jgi:hypothetical protein
MLVAVTVMAGRKQILQVQRIETGAADGDVPVFAGDLFVLRR